MVYILHLRSWDSERHMCEPPRLLTIAVPSSVSHDADLWREWYESGIPTRRFQVICSGNWQQADLVPFDNGRDPVIFEGAPRISNCPILMACHGGGHHG